MQVLYSHLGFTESESSVLKFRNLHFYHMDTYHLGDFYIPIFIIIDVMESI